MIKRSEDPSCQVSKRARVHNTITWMIVEVFVRKDNPQILEEQDQIENVNAAV